VASWLVPVIDGGDMNSSGVGRSIAAVVAGIMVSVLLELGTDVVLHAVGVFPPWGQPVSDGPLALAIGYRAVFGVVGSYVAARLAPNGPMLHAMVVGVLGFVAGVAGAIGTWNRGAEFGPHWYPVALILIALPCAWLGGKIREMQLR
jgi:hypothetical protein